jgi:methylmalonyl-CoA mutase N-terminal domain/subunit
VAKLIDRASGLGPNLTPEYQELVERWQTKADRTTARAGKGSGAVDRTISDIPLKTVYGPGDVEHLDLTRDLSVPGEFPYTRGIHPTMYRSRLWTMRQFAGFGNAKQTNERYHFLLSQGQMGLSVAFDMPTLMGYDSDNPKSLGEVGKCGCAIDSIRDMETLFEGIDLGAITTSMTINGPAAIALALYIVTAENKGIPRAKLGGTLQADILKEYIAQKEWIFPPRPHVRIIVDMMEFCAREMPKWNTISVSGYHIREAGSTAAQELAFTLADGFAYVQEAQRRGMDVDEFAPRLSFFFNSHIDFFEEIAKFRAARRIYARHMRDRFGAKDPRSWQLRFHTQTAGCSATAQQPENNIVRVAFEAMAAALGGTQSLHTNSMDEVLALPTEKSVEIALRTQQVLAYETNVTNVVDPLGGAYFVEALTDEMERQVEEYFARIDEYGGMVAAVEAGFPQREIADASYRYQRSIESGERVIVGVNAFERPDEQQAADLLKIGAEIERGQARAVQEVRANRDAGAVEAALAGLKRACAGTENVMPHLIDCVKAVATEGEIVDAMVSVYGRYTETTQF